jgi:hypothetical protein
MPADEPSPESPFERFEIDPDAEPDILPGAADENEGDPDFPANPAFHPPTPGDRISEERLEEDLGE